MRKIARILAFSSLIAFVLVGAFQKLSPAAPALPEAVALGTSSIGSMFYVHAVGIADIITKHADINISVESVGGSDANVRAIKNGVVSLAIANTFSSGNGFRGTRQFTGDGKIPLRLIALGPPTLRQLVARKRSKIKTVLDCEGKRLVAKRRALAEIELVADAMLEAYGVSKKKVTYITTATTREAIDALMSRSVDAAVLPGGIPAGTITRIFEQRDMVYISLPPDKMVTVLEKLGPSFREEVIPAGTYRHQSEDVHTPSLYASLVVGDGFPEEAVYQITKALFSHYEDLKLVHAAAKHWTVKNSLLNFHIPFHLGAIKYYKEIGAWTSKCEEEQQRWLKE